MECFDCLLLRQSNDSEGVSDCKAVLFCYTVTVQGRQSRQGQGRRISQKGTGERGPEEW